MTQLAALNVKHYFVRTVVSEFAELMVMVTFTYQAVIPCFIQIFFCFFVVPGLKSMNKEIGLLMIKIFLNVLNLCTDFL